MYVLIGLAKEIRPVAKTACHQPGVNVVELVVIDPEVFGIIDDELEVWWYPEAYEYAGKQASRRGHTLWAGRDSDLCQ